MLRPQPVESRIPRRAAAGLLSVGLHLGLVAILLLAGGRDDGSRDLAATLEARVVPLESKPASTPDAVEPSEKPQELSEVVPEPPPDGPRLEPVPVPPPELDLPEPEAWTVAAAAAAAGMRTDGAVTDATGPPRITAMAPEQASELAMQIEALARDLVRVPRAEHSWQRDGRQYHLRLVLEPSADSFEPERAIAEVVTEDQGRRLRTWIRLKRLPFSHYAKLVDRWDPMVQLHDDEVVGRMHVNSRFNLLHDAEAMPRLLGKVTTAATGINLERRGGLRAADLFLAGLETRAERIPFSAAETSFERLRHRDDAQLHELEGETWIRFHAGGGYSWRAGDSSEWRYVPSAGDRPVFLMAAAGGTVRVAGVVAGRVLVYSPDRIVIAGSLTYARDPRREPESGDYLGLVCERDIEVAPPHVTGPGDLHVHAALFARRRMLVRDADRASRATLALFGSLAAGTVSESEPRYAMRIEYDRRFDRYRPPGFPSTPLFRIDEWDRAWTEVGDGPPSSAP